MHNAAPVGWEVLTAHTFYALRQPEPHRHAPTLSSFHNKRQPENAFDTFSGCLLFYISTPAYITDTNANTHNATSVGWPLAAHAFYALRQSEAHEHTPIPYLPITIKGSLKTHPIFRTPSYRPFRCRYFRHAAHPRYPVLPQNPHGYSAIIWHWLPMKSLTVPSNRIKANLADIAKADVVRQAR